MLEETGVLEPLGNLSGLTQTVNGEARARSGTCLPPDMPYCLLPQSQHLFFFFFPFVPQCLWDLSSPTRDQIQALGSDSVEF